MKFLLIVLLMGSSMAEAQYNRKEWRHWLDSDKDCQNTRSEMLIKENLGVLTFTNRKKCTVKTGKWSDFYYNDYLYEAKDIDVDHVVPLKHAADIGGQLWTDDLKAQFANDPDNLVLTYKKFNRQKGAKTITEWLPSNREYACKYAKRWQLVKNKYKLPISNEEKSTINMLKCN